MNSRNRNLAVCAVGVALLAAAAWAERGDDATRKSKNGLLRGEIDGIEIVVEYGRPNVQDRRIWGGLVPWDAVWRTGADEATTISFSSAVLVEGESLPAGRYGFFSIPGMETWTLIFNNIADQWGAFGYSEEEDALRVEVAPQNALDHVETLTFGIEGDKVALSWEKIAVSFSVQSAD